MIDTDGNKIGVMSVEDALNIARDRGLDLVEVAPSADPPVCKIMDYHKFLFEEKKKEKLAKKKQAQGIKEMQFYPRIDVNDYNTKMKKIVEFLKDNQCVKININLKGRVRLHPELADSLMERIIEDTKEIAELSGEIKKTEKSYTFTIVPKKKKGE